MAQAVARCLRSVVVVRRPFAARAVHVARRASARSRAEARSFPARNSPIWGSVPAAVWTTVDQDSGKTPRWGYIVASAAGKE